MKHLRHTLFGMLLLSLLLAVTAVPAAAEVPPEPALALDTSLPTTLYLDNFGSDAGIRVSLQNHAVLSEYYGSDPLWTLSSPNGEDAYFLLESFADAAVCRYNYSAAEAGEFTLEVTCSWGDVSSTLEVPFTIAEIPEALASRERYMLPPVALVLGESHTVTKEELIPADCGLPVDLIRIGSYSYSEVCVPTFDEEGNMSFTPTASGEYCIAVDWHYSNLVYTSIIGVAAAESEEALPNVSSIDLEAAVYCNQIITNYYSYVSLLKVSADNYAVLQSLHNGTAPQWSVTITGDTESIVQYYDYGEFIEFYMPDVATTAADITIEVTCSISDMSQSYTHQITVHEYDVSDFPGVAIPQYIMAQAGQTFTLDAQEMLYDPSWTLPFGSPRLEISVHDGNDILLLSGTDGTVHTFEPLKSGCYKADLIWRWANFVSSSQIAVVIADENGVYADIEPELSVSYHTNALFANGNRYVDVAYLEFDNYTSLDALYDVESLTWSVSSVSGTDAGFEVNYNIDSPSWGYLALTDQATAAGTAEIVISADFDFADDSRNTTIQQTVTLDIIEASFDIPENDIQLPDVIVDPGEEFAIDFNLLERDIEADFWINSYWQTNTSPWLNNLGTDNGVTTYTAMEAGVFRQFKSWVAANVSITGYADIYVRNADGTVDALPTFELIGEDHFDVLYENSILTPNLATYTVPNARELCRYYGTYSINWDVARNDNLPYYINYYTYGEYNDQLILSLGSQLEQAGELSVTVTAKCRDDQKADTYSLTVAPNPGFTADEIVYTDPISLVVGQPLTIPAAALLPDAFDPALFNASFTQENAQDYLTCTCESNEVILTAQQAGLCKVTFHWSVEHYQGTTVVVFRIGEDENSIPEMPEFSIEEEVFCEAIYIGGDASQQLISYNIPNTEALWELYGVWANWEYTIENDVENLIWVGYQGPYNNRLNFYFNYPTVETELVINVACTFNGETLTRSFTVPVKGNAPDNYPSCSSGETIYMQVGQVLSLDARELVGEWALDIGVPTLKLLNHTEDIPFLGQEGSVVSWALPTPGAYQLEFLWQWHNYSTNAFFMVIVSDENGNPPHVEPDINSFAYHPVIATNGNYESYIGGLVLENYDALSVLHGIEDVDWSYHLTTDTGLTLSENSGSNYFNLYIASQPVTAGSVTVDMTGVIRYNDGRASDTIHATISFDVAETDNITDKYVILQREYMSVGDTCTISRELLNDYNITINNETYQVWLNNWNLPFLSEIEEGYVFSAEAPGLYAAEFCADFANIIHRCMVYFFVADEDGNYPAEPEFQMEHTSHADTAYVNGNTTLLLDTYHIPNAEALQAISFGRSVDWSVQFSSHDEMFYCNRSGNNDDTLRLYLNYIPSEPLEITITVTASCGDRQLTSSKIFRIAEGPAQYPADLAADQILRAKAGETFSIDAAAFSEEWSLDEGTPTLTLTTCEGTIEFLGAEGSVHTWRALQSGIYDLHFEWSWSNYACLFSRRIIVADENGNEPVLSADFHTTYFYPVLYTNGNTGRNFADVYLDNYNVLDSMYGIEQVNWEVGSISGSDMTVRLDTSSTYAYLNIDSQPTVPGETTIMIRCSIDCTGDAYDTTYIIPVTVAVEEAPFTASIECYHAGSLVVSEHQEFTILTTDCLPEAMQPYADSITSWLNEYSADLQHVSSYSDRHTFIAPASGVYYVKLQYDLSNIFGYCQIIILVADADGTVPELPVFQVTENIELDTLYLDGYSPMVTIATYTIDNAQELYELYGYEPVWSYEGSVALHANAYGNHGKQYVVSRNLAQLQDNTPLEYTVTCTLGDETKTFTHTVQVLENPNSFWPNGFADSTPIRTQVGQTFTIDASALQDGWSLPTGTPILELLSNTDAFELVSTDGSLYTYQALQSGFFSNNYRIIWANFDFEFSRSVLVADENGVYPSTEPDFRYDFECSTIFVNGNYRNNIANIRLENFDALNALCGETTLTWSLDSNNHTGASFYLSSWNGEASIFLDQSPTQTGSFTLGVTCTIECDDESISGIYDFHFSLTAVENPGAELEERVLAYTTIVSPGETFIVDTSIAVMPPELDGMYDQYATFSVAGCSNNLIMEGPDRITAPYQSGVYRIDYQWRIANLSGYRYVDVYVTDAEGNVPETPSPDIEVIIHHDALYTGGNDLVDIVSFVVEDYYALNAYYPDSFNFHMNGSCDGNGVDLIGQGVSSHDPFTFTYFLTGTPSQTGSLSFAASVSVEGKTLSDSGLIGISILEGPNYIFEGLDPAGSLVMEPGGTFTVDASQLKSGWSLPTGTPTLEYYTGNASLELVSVDGPLYTWKTPEESGTYWGYFLVRWANYSELCTYGFVVADEDGNIPQPEVKFQHTVYSDPIFVNGNSTAPHVATLQMDRYSQPALEAVYGFDSVVWEVTSVEGSDATFRIEQWGSDHGYLFIVDQPSYAGTATINADCILKAADGTELERFPTSITIGVEEWTGGSYIGTNEYGPFTFQVNEPFSLHHSEFLPEGVDFLDGAWESGCDELNGLEWIDIYEYLQMLPTKAGENSFMFTWRWRNLMGNSIIHLRITDENGVVPPTVSINETVMDDKVYINGGYCADLMRFELENAQAVTSYAGSDVYWSVETIGDYDGVLHTETSGDYNEHLLITTDVQPTGETTIQLSISCQIGSLGTVYSTERTVNIVTGPDTQPVLSLPDPIWTQLGETLTLDAQELVGSWNLPTGTPTLTLESDKVELVSCDGSMYTYRALEAGSYDVYITWQWNTFLWQQFTTLIVTDEAGNLPLIAPDVTHHYWFDTIYTSGNSLGNPVSVYLNNLDTLQLLYGYKDIQWSITSNNGFEEYFELEFYDQNCHVLMTKQPAAAADVLLEITGVFDAEDDQYDQVITYDLSLTFAELENPPFVADEWDMPLMTTYFGGQFGFTYEDILPNGFTLPTGEPEFWFFDHFDMHQQLYAPKGSWLFTARESGLFRMMVAWQWANYSGITYVNLYVEPDNSDSPFWLYTNRGFNRTIYSDGDLADSQYFRIDTYDQLGGEAQWSLKHVYGTNFGYKLSLNEYTSHEVTISMSDLPTSGGFEILEVTCEVGGYSYTQPVYIRSTTIGSNRPTWLDYPDEFDRVVGHAVYLDAYHAYTEDGTDYWEGGEQQSLQVDSFIYEIWDLSYQDMLDLTPLASGKHTVRLRWECSNLVLYKDIIINATTVLPEDIDLRERGIWMLPGMSYQLHLTKDVGDAEVWWWSDNESVATLDQNGILTAVAEGTAIVNVYLTGSDDSTMTICYLATVLPDLTTMTLPVSLTTIDDEAFYGSAAGYVIIPSGVKSIGESAFANMPNLQLVSIPATVTSIPASCFSGTSAAILCEEGSAAESYAVQQGIPYFIVK